MTRIHDALKLGLAAATLALAGCSTMTGTLFPDKPAQPPAPANASVALPQTGTSFFAPVPVAPGTSTATAQGQRIAELRNRLVAIQGEISSRNASLSEIRQRAASEGALYRIAKSEIATVTTPTPASIQKAQGLLERFGATTTALDTEMRVFAKGAAETNKLMNESVAIRDTNEEDTNQLNTLRGEVGLTANQLDRLVNEISNEWALQSAFLAKERASLASLGATTTPAIAASAPAAASAAMLASPAFVTIKFDRPNVSYRDALAQAVSAAKRRKPTTSFDVVAVAAGRSVTPEATALAQDVANTLGTLGVETAKIRLFNAVGANLQAHEVRIYAR